MIADLQECHDAAGALKAALCGHDPRAIIAASERLAVAVVMLRDRDANVTAVADAALLIGEVLGLLDAAARQVNMLRDGARQRIDNMHMLRGSAVTTYSPAA